MFEKNDVVVCVDAAPRFPDSENRRACRQLRAGRMYRVAGMAQFDSGVLIAGIRAEFERQGYGWQASRFRKLERASESFTLSIKRHADEPVS